MKREEIKTCLPHREPMLLLDEVCLEGAFARGYYRIKGDEWFLDGHFPGNPIVPGVILCEILAQSVSVLLKEQMTDRLLPMLTGLDQVRFKSPVRPGDLFETKCRIVKKLAPFYFAEGTGFVNGKVSVKANFSFALT